MDFGSLTARFQGELLTPHSAGYEAVRRIWSGMIDRKPAAIARCRRPEDVVEAFALPPIEISTPPCARAATTWQGPPGRGWPVIRV